jgi:hypothetical protein
MQWRLVRRRDGEPDSSPAPAGDDVGFHEVLVGDPEAELRFDEKQEPEERHRVDAGRLERVVGLHRTAPGHDIGVDEGSQDLGELFGI